MYEVYSDKPHIVRKRYWRDYKCAVAYACKLSMIFVNDFVSVREVSDSLLLSADTSLKDTVTP